MAPRATSPAPGGGITHGAPGKRRHCAEGYRTGPPSPSVKNCGLPIAGGGVERAQEEAHEDDSRRRQRHGGADSRPEAHLCYLEHGGIDKRDLKDAHVSERCHHDVERADHSQPGEAAVDRGLENEELAEESRDRRPASETIASRRAAASPGVVRAMAARSRTASLCTERA